MTLRARAYQTRSCRRVSHTHIHKHSRYEIAMVYGLERELIENHVRSAREIVRLPRCAYTEAYRNRGMPELRAFVCILYVQNVRV